MKRTTHFGLLFSLALTLAMGGCRQATEDSVVAERADDSSSNLETGNELTDDTVTKSQTVSQALAQDQGKDATKPMANMKKMAAPDTSWIKFRDTVDSNVEVPKGLDELVFIDKDGDRVELKSYIGKRNIVLVFTKGFNGMLCPFCKTQTSRLVANYEKFSELDTEILVVYPGVRDHLDEFVTAALKTEKKQVDKVPFPIVLDEDFVATDFFGIRGNNAHPSTYLVDKSGEVQLAYVGEDMTADRPSIKAILDKINKLNQ